jgi:hypothetical protein
VRTSNAIATLSPGGTKFFFRRSRVRRLLLAGAAVVVILLVAAQILLPRIAESQVRSALGAQATGVRVEIAAMPAVELLWHQADRVAITIDRLTPNSSQGGTVGDMLSGLNVAPQVDLRVHDLHTRTMDLHDVSLHKHGDLVVVRALVGRGALAAGLPAGIQVRPLPGPGGQIRLEGSASPLGTHISIRAALLADDGRIVVRPVGLPFASMLTIPVFSDSRIAVEGLSAVPSQGGFVITASARLRNA